MTTSRKYLLILALTAMSLLAAPGRAAAQSPRSASDTVTAAQINDVFVQATDRVRPAVVMIRVYKESDASNGSSEAMGLGSGVIVDPKGWVLTNHHVVADTDKVEVVLADHRRYVGQDVLSDQDTDLAVIRIDPEGEPLPFATFGDSDSVRAGHLVLAMGNPFGEMLEQTVTMGIVSYRGRQTGIFGHWGYEDFIQTDAAINRGNSGGPLVNLDGQVIGINDNILTPTGISAGYGFAIPGNRAKYVAQQLIEHGQVKRGYLGIQMMGMEDLRSYPEDRLQLYLERGLQRAIQDSMADLDEAGVSQTVERMMKAAQAAPPDMHGAFVTLAVPGSPAQKAGIQEGDIIYQLNDTTINDSRQLRDMVAKMPPGETVTCHFLRNEQRKSTDVVLADRGAARDREETEQAQRQRRQPPAWPMPWNQAPEGPDRPPFPPMPWQDQPEPQGRAKLGIGVQTLTEKLAQEYGYPTDTKGILVDLVQPESLAEKCGLQKGDVILTVNGDALDSVDQLKRIVTDTDLSRRALEFRVLTPDGEKTRVVKEGPD